MIRGDTKGAFGTKLGRVLSASGSSHSVEYLKGHDRELETIKQSLFAPARHVFIYGTVIANILT